MIITEWSYGLVLQPDGKIVVTGQAHNGIDDDVIVVRLKCSPGTYPDELYQYDDEFKTIH
jgi:hypothetical protein